ncbi:MAG: adenylate/guanylate cyclase domain-containing protein [Dehalococcoidales bacterium]|nr:adenylate/guanylate cyclase domain-containing protein [Dehalococcoidales bacterium]
MSLLSRKKTRHVFTGLLTALTIGLAFSLMFQFNLFHGVQLQSGDFFFRAPGLSAKTDPAPNVLIVGIDDRSLAELGNFSSWPRSYHARVIDKLSAAGARVIVFDVLFAEPAPGDELLAASIKQAGNVVLPMVYAPAVSGTTGNTVNFGNTLKPLDVFADNAFAIGHANVLPDEDGVVRRIPLIIPAGDRYEPAISLAAVSKYLRRSQVIESPVDGGSLPFAGRSISLDRGNRMLINYTGASAAPLKFETVSYADVLQGDITPAVFKDKLVLIGAIATGLGDIFWTPSGRMMNGVELHASAMNTILTGNFLKPASSWLTIMLTLLLALLCGLLVMRLTTLWASLALGFLCAGYLLTAFLFFDRGVMLNLLYPPVAAMSAFVGLNLQSVAYERSRKLEITRTFGRYVSTPVVGKILTALDENKLKLGGEQRQVTVAFADIRGFTTLAENTPPDRLVAALNSCLAAVIKVFLKHDGMINKFGGDSIMAVWNAPTDCPKHALLATMAAVEAQRAVDELLQKDPSLPRVSFGIGINSGLVTAGNLGYKDRLEYSVIGDAVNVASRITSATPGGRVWIGAQTYDAIKDRVTVKPLEPFLVKGRQQPVIAYEIIDIGARM